MLGAHPSVLNVSELFAGLQPRAFPPGEISGERFWRMLREPQAAWSVALRHGLEPSEFAYPLDARGRFDRLTGVPPILGVCLPTLTDEPDLLYRELEEAVPSFPAGRIGALYGLLFRWLAERFDKPLWVERSGGSLSYVEDIAAQFERPRFIHLYRNGCDTAVSMSRHSFFRMAVVREMLTAALGHDPFEKGAREPDTSLLSPELQRLLPDTFDPQTLRDLSIPLERFGRRWSAMILHGTGRLARLSNADVCHLSYEELLSAPQTTLERLVGFFEISPPPAGWFDRAATLVKSPPPSRPRLPTAVRERLRRACEPGERRLRAVTRP
jgi:hypothetical protein